MFEHALLRITDSIFEEYAVMDGDDCVGRILHSFGSGQAEWLWVIVISNHSVQGDHGRSNSCLECEIAFLAALAGSCGTGDAEG